MDTRRSADPLTDAAIDRELQRALAVNPSPEFVARVRTRIASEPAPRAWQFSWAMSFAGGAVVAAVIVMAVARMRPERVVPGGPAPALAARTIVGARATLPAVDPPVVPAFRRAAGPAEAAHYRSVPIPESAPLFDSRETRALQTLIAGVRGGNVDLTPLLKPAGPAPMELPPVDNLVIAPLAIEPLAPIDGVEGVRQ